MPQQYRNACNFLPLHLREEALKMPEAERVEEFRLRVGQCLYATTPKGETPVSDKVVTPADLEQVVDLVTGCSRYAAEESMRSGYLTADGGFRIGLCGTAILERGEVIGYKDLSSLAIRIPREQIGVSRPILTRLVSGGRFPSTLILSPPGGGKTTLLRDMVRELSDAYRFRVSLVDERGELAAVHRCQPQLQVGRHTDVLEACPKAAAVPLLLRTMNPQIIAVDEVATAQDVSALDLAVGAGVTLLATAHSSNLSELMKKPLFSDLMERGIFENVICIEKKGGRRNYRVEQPG